MIGEHYFQISAWLKDKLGQGCPPLFRPPIRKTPKQFQVLSGLWFRKKKYLRGSEMLFFNDAYLTEKNTQ